MRDSGAQSTAFAILMLASVSACNAVMGYEEGETTDGGDGGPVPCNVDPWICPTGQTCWISVDQEFRCMNSGAADEGEPCTPILGTTECSDGLVCVSVSSTRQCLPFCNPYDPQRACPNGRNCTAAYYELDGQPLGPIHVCQPL